jgi:hypothetical protein
MRQPHRAGGALEQPRAEPLLHTLQQIGDGRARDLQIIRCLGKALTLGDAHKDPHFLEAIHSAWLPAIIKVNGTMIPSYDRLSLKRNDP